MEMKMTKEQLLRQLEAIQDEIWELKERELETLEELAKLAPEFEQQAKWLREDMGLPDDE